jgi:hypothetical protein
MLRAHRFGHLFRVIASTGKEYTPSVTRSDRDPDEQADGETRGDAMRATSEAFERKRWQVNVIALFVLMTFGPLVVLGQGIDVSCDEPLVLPESKFMVFGEIHGTNETPALVARHICTLVQRGERLILALEVPTSEQPRLDRYMASEGLEADIIDLISGMFWQTVRDGRSSVAVFKLIDRARELLRSGGDVRLVAMDGQRTGELNDASMGQAIRREAQARPDAAIVALAGSIHAMNQRGLMSDPDYEPMAYRLSDLSPTTVLVASRVGSAWACRGAVTCTVDCVDCPTVGFNPGISPLPGYNGTFVLESTSTSPPMAETP